MSYYIPSAYVVVELSKEDAGKYAAILAEGMAHDYGRNV